MVYSMLMESDQYKDAADFKQTELYQKCVVAGVIPGTTENGNQPATVALSAKPPDRKSVV